MVSRRFIGSAFTVLVSTFLAALISHIIGIFPGYSFVITIVFGVISFLLVPLYISHGWFSRQLWKLLTKWRLKNPTIGIVEQTGCPLMYTDFSPADWKRRLGALSVTTELISISKIDTKFAAIVNPYGETYPEEDLLSLKTLQKIKDYVRKGGIFVCAGGLAFFYGFDFKTGRNPALAKELDIYVQRSPPATPLVLGPQRTYPPLYSLVDTPLVKHFKIVTTWRDTERNPVFQDPTDRRFVGDIANTGGISEVLQFRATREPIRKCIPFLRATSTIGTVYVIAGVPLGKGCLIICGMDLRRQPHDPNWDPTIHQANFEKICQALVNLIASRRDGLIPISAEDW
jgi:hypothetical protein